MPFLGLAKIYDGNNFLYHVGGRTGIGIQRCDEKYADDRFVQNRVGLHHMCFRARSREDVDRIGDKLKLMGALSIRPVDGDWMPVIHYMVFE